MNMHNRVLVIMALAAGFSLAAIGPALAMKTYTMQEGDTLWDLSSKFYGDPTLYPVFLEVNDIANPRTIPVGKVILVPSYDEMKKIAQEPDPEKRKKLITQITGGSAPADPVAPPPATTDPAKPPSKPSTGPVDPKEVSLKKILEGPTTTGDKIEKLDTPPENAR
ncbi:MAG: hypothetical protein OZSIB_0270 [Candidatus Ozemobacter sibiricus]|uniref:LysM domain-containing protein n=1 Tax=Candidatus Ozemobacter sibiricus TaxID=2268124 RepID=A0A367ZMA4_9BACT|nr:MAG: hypothetical protein OZSIB_0270 [Candidatus Ozemobacter sibiricus]